MCKKIGSLVIVFLILSISPVYGKSLEGKKVTVTKFPASGQQAKEVKWLKVGLADMILNDLAATGKLDVVPRRALEKLMKEQKLQKTGVIDEKTAVEIGNLVGADLLISGNYQLMGGFLRINATVYDVGKGKSLGGANVSGDLEKVFVLEKKLVSDLLKNLGLKLTQEQKINLFRTSTKNVEALEKNYKGELALDKGQTGKAKKYFQEAQDIEPGFEEAQSNIKKVQKVDEQKFASAFHSKLSKVEKRKKIREHQVKKMKNILSYLARDLWNVRLLPINSKEDMSVNEDGTVDIKSTVQVTWNYDTIKRFIKDLKEIDKSTVAEKTWSIPYKIQDDRSEVKVLEFKTFEEVMEVFNKAHEYFRNIENKHLFLPSKIKILAMNSNREVIKKSPEIKWGSSWDPRWHENSNDHFHIMPFGSSKFFKGEPGGGKIAEGGYLHELSKNQLIFALRNYSVKDIGSKFTMKAKIKNIPKSKVQQIDRLKLDQRKVKYSGANYWMTPEEFKKHIMENSE